MIKSFSPYVISASRATDIPAFYGDWFTERLKRGFFHKRNPFNGDKYKIDLKNTELIVFWTKNVEPFFKHLEYFDKYFPNYYFQYTLNNYGKDIERNLPNLDKRIIDFINLSERIGKEKVIWRFDPLLLSEKINQEQLFDRIEYIAKKIHMHTNKLVFSYVDIYKYKKISNRLNKLNLNLKEFDFKSKVKFADKLSILTKKYNIEIASCAEEIKLNTYGIKKNKCIDDKLIKELFPENEQLISFLSDKKTLKDKGQRKSCGCIVSKDIGQYNTCVHSCVYCYANVSNQSAVKNYKMHTSQPLKESII